MVGHFIMPKRADSDIKWLIVYVLLSRVRSLERLRSIGIDLKIKKIIEGGPPEMIAKNFLQTFGTKIKATKDQAEIAKSALGW